MGFIRCVVGLITIIFVTSIIMLGIGSIFLNLFDHISELEGENGENKSNT